MANGYVFLADPTLGRIALTIEQFEGIWSGVALRILQDKINDVADTAKSQPEDLTSEYTAIHGEESLFNDDSIKYEPSIDINSSEEQSDDMYPVFFQVNNEDSSDALIHVSLEEQAENFSQQNNAYNNPVTVDKSFERIQSVNKDERTLLTLLSDLDVMNEQIGILVPVQSGAEFEASVVAQNPVVEDKSTIQTEAETPVVEIMIIKTAKNELSGVTATVSEEIISEASSIDDYSKTETKKVVPEVSAVVQVPAAKNTQAKQHTQLDETEMELIRGRLAPLIIIGAIKAIKVIGTVAVVAPSVVNKAVPGVKAVAKSTKSATEIVQRAMSQAELTATQKTGLLRGGRNGIHYVSNAINSNAKRAQQRLSLPQRPEVRVTLEVPSGRFSQASRILPYKGMPGGGMERKATGNVPVRVINVRRFR